MAAQEYRAPAADADLAGNGPEAWVAHAWDIAAEGREIAAVEWLTSRNRERRSEQAERALVQLRHRAFARCESGGGRLSWPPQFDDAFPDASGVPEVMARSLTPSTLGAGIVHHGALLVRGLVDSKQAARFCDGIDRTFDACAAAMEEGQSARGPWYARFKPVPPYSVGAARNWVWQGGGVWTADSPRMVFELLEAFEGAGLRQVLSGYLGERPAMSLKKCTLRRVPVETGTDWHQDGAFLGEGIRTVNVWLALTHCGDVAPGLDIVPKRFDVLVETGTNGAQFDWSVGPGTVERVAGEVGVVRPVFEPGDALLFDEKFLHRTGVSPGMTDVRYAIESWFFAPSHYPHDQVPVYF